MFLYFGLHKLKAILANSISDDILNYWVASEGRPAQDSDIVIFKPTAKVSQYSQQNNPLVSI